MSKSGGFSIAITAQDRASATLDRINKRLERASAPVTRLGKSFDRLSKNVGFADTLRGVRALRRELAGAAGAMGQLGGGLGGLLGAGSIAGAAALANRYANVGSNLFLMARQARTSVPHLQRLQNAAALAGGSAEGAGQAFVGLQNNLQSAAAGHNTEAMAALNQLHVNWGGAGHALPAGQVLEPLLQKLAAVKNLTLQAKLGTMIFGSSFAAIQPLLMGGVHALNRYNTAGARMVTWTNREAQNARMLQTGIRRLGGDIENTAYAAAGQFAPAVTRVANEMATWIENNQHAAQTLSDVGIALGGLMAIRPAAWLLRLLGISTMAVPAVTAASVLALRGDSGPTTSRQRMQQYYEDLPNSPTIWPMNAPNGSMPSLPSTAARRSTMTQLQRYFLSQGWSRQQVAGIMSGASAESGFNPAATGDHGTSHGLFQIHAQRYRLEKIWMARHHGNINDPMWQARFVQHELTHGDQQRAGHDLRRTTTARGAGFVFNNEFERPAGGQATAAMRANAAHLFLPPVQPAQTHTVKGAAHVHINLAGAPPGTRVSAHTDGPLFTGAPRVTMPMPPGGGPT